MKGIIIRPYRDDDEPSYRAFCDREFGPGTYQGRRDYLQWLYVDNPSGKGFTDCLVAAQASGEIIGCIHKLRMPWQVGPKGAITMPSLHNLMVTEAFRGGTGFFLLRAAVTDESHALVPGVVGNLVQAYERMKYQKIHTRWYRRVVRFDRATWQTLMHKAGRPEPQRRVPTELNRSMHGLRVTSRPDDESIRAIAVALAPRTKGAEPFVAHVDWSAAVVKWRFFSDRGPRHVVASDEADGTFAILSLGPRHGVTVARMIAWSPTVVSASFLERIRRVAATQGAAALLAYDARPDDAASLAGAGWQPMASPPQSFVYVRDKQQLSLDLDGGATDLGLEAMPSSST